MGKIQHSTIRTVAQRAGVSPATVSRVIGNYGYVSQATRRKVEMVIQELGYRPDNIARSLVTKNTHTLGLILTDILNPFFAELARGVESITYKNEFSLLIANTDEDIEREKTILNTFIEKHVDGILLVPATSKASTHLQEIIEKQIPLVLVDRNAENISVDTVMVDNEIGAYRAVSHLIERGHEKIAMILDNPDISTNMERLAGYRRALLDYGLVTNDLLVRCCQYTTQSAHEIVYELLKEKDRPTALFTANNFITIGAIRAIFNMGMRIPEDVALVGFDDLGISQIGYPTVTAVVQPVYELGQTAAQRLLARLAGDKGVPQEIRLQTSFIVRQSS